MCRAPGPIKKLPSASVLELCAIHLAHLNFQDHLSQMNMYIWTDNTAKAHVNCQGGTEVKKLQQKSLFSFFWAEQYMASLRAEHISRLAGLGGLSPQLGNIPVSGSRFWLIVRRSSYLSGQCKTSRFFSRYQCQQAELVWMSPWLSGYLYAFPPIPLIPKLLNKMNQKKAALICLSSFWARRP